MELAGLIGRTAVNMPVLTAGSPLREDGIVLERSLARALGIEVGATLQTRPDAARSTSVLGTAVVPSQPRYPRRNPGLAWITRATLEQESNPIARAGRWDEALRLANPSDAAAFSEQAAALSVSTTTRPVRRSRL